MGELAHYVVDTYEQGDTTKYVELFSSIESVLENGDSEVQNLIRVGLLEDSILRAYPATGRGPQLPHPYRKPASRRRASACSGSCSSAFS